MSGWLRSLFRGPTLHVAVRARIARRLGMVAVPAIPLLGVGALATALFGDPVRVAAPAIGILVTLTAIPLVRRDRWLDAVAMGIAGVLTAAVVETALFGLGAPTLWVPLVLLGVVTPLYGTRGAMALVGFVALLAGGALVAQTAGWLESAAPTWVQHVSVLVQFTLMGAVLLADPMNLLTGSLAESEQARNDLEAAEFRFRAIFDQSSSLFSLLSADGTLIDLNQAAREEFGEVAKGSLGHRIVDAPWWSGDQSEAIRTGLEAAARGVAHRFELVLDGPPTRVFSAQLAPFRDPAGDVRAVVLEMMDISDLVEARQMLQHKQRLEALGQLAGGVAHDFNNLLGAVMASAHMLAEDPVIRDDEDRLELARIIRDASERGAGLTRKLLAFGRRDAPSERVNVDTLFASTTKMLRRSLGADVELVVELAAPDAWVVGDAAALDAMLVNLAVNARDAMPDGGQLRIRTDIIELDPSYVGSLPEAIQAGPTLRIQVEDTGEGMSEATLARAFEPFFTTKPVGAGTGLGLSAVHGTVQTHQGTVQLESQPGQGCSFQIFLPLAPGAVPAPAPSSVPTAPADLGTVLVVDDELVMRRAVAAQFRAHGVRVHLAGSVEEAEQLLEQVRVDAVLTDVVMPGRNGFELVQLLRRRDPDLPVVAMTGFARVEPAVGQPEVPVVRKPFEWPELLAAFATARGARVAERSASQA